MKKMKKYIAAVTMLATGVVLVHPAFNKQADQALGAVKENNVSVQESDQKTTDVTTEAYMGETTRKQDDKFYGIGSVSKMFATVAVLKLSDEGKLDLNTPITEYIPEFTMEDERYKKITPLMLLNHSSGLLGTVDHNAFEYGKDDTEYHDTILEYLSHQKLKADPGEFSVYCNDGFTLAEILVERVSGMTYSEFIRQEISEPLGLNDTFTPVENFDEKRIADIVMDGHLMPYMNCHCIGSGGIYSTSEDIARFGQIFTKDGTKILSKESIDLMQKAWYQNDAFGVCEGDNQQGYGLGWDSVDMYPFNRYGIKALSKGGELIGYHANLTVLPEQNLSIAINTAGEGNVVAGEMAQDIILEVLLEEGLIDNIQDVSIPPETMKTGEAIPKEYQEYAGYYISSKMMSVEFTENNTLRLRAADSDYELSGEFIYIGNGEFQNNSGVYLNQNGFAINSNGTYGKTILSFCKESNGKTYLKGKMYESKQGLGETAYQMLIGEKVEDNVLPEKVKQQWQLREGKKYYLVNEGYNSSQFTLSPYVKAELIEGMNSYIKSTASSKPCRIVDRVTAVCEMSIPGMLGRDLVSYSFYDKNECEYLHINELSYMTEDGMKSSSKLGNEVIVSEDLAVWYRIEDADASKIITIEVPEKAAFFLYDEDDQCIASSIYVGETNTVVLPKRGHLVFVGEPGTVFQITK